MPRSYISTIGGASDGTHIQAGDPCLCAIDVFYLKESYSVNVQGTTVTTIMLIKALVGFRKRFMGMHIGWPGSVADGHCFANPLLKLNI